MLPQPRVSSYRDSMKRCGRATTSDARSSLSTDQYMEKSSRSSLCWLFFSAIASADALRAYVGTSPGLVGGGNSVGSTTAYSFVVTVSTRFPQPVLVVDVTRIALDFSSVCRTCRETNVGGPSSARGVRYPTGKVKALLFDMVLVLVLVLVLMLVQLI